jgi:protein-tyrosine phosphatase
MAFLGERKRLEGDISGKELQRALWTDPPASRCMPGVPRYLDSTERLKIRKDCDEVFPGIILGSGSSIKDMNYMLDLGVTHVINCAEQDVRIDPSKFAKQGICYKGFCCKDLPGAPISQYFDECSDFIERALSMRCGMVFIACYMGNSTSAAVATAYLMQKKNYTATQALQYMRKTREVQPNLGFLQQLAEQDNALRKERYRHYKCKLVEIKYSI